MHHAGCTSGWVRVNVSNVSSLSPGYFPFHWWLLFLPSLCTGAFCSGFTGHNETSSGSELFPFHCWRVVSARVTIPVSLLASSSCPAYTRLLLIKLIKLRTENVRKDQERLFTECENRGVCGRRISSRINRGAGRKLARRAYNPATESTFAQGRLFYEELSFAEQKVLFTGFSLPAQTLGYSPRVRTLLTGITQE